MWVPCRLSSLILVWGMQLAVIWMVKRCMEAQMGPRQLMATIRMRRVMMVELSRKVGTWAWLTRFEWWGYELKVAGSSKVWVIVV